MRSIKNPLSPEKDWKVNAEHRYVPKLSILERINRAVTAWRINTGKLPHGRTAPSFPGGGGEGGAVIRANTVLEVKHFRNGEEIVESRRVVLDRIVTNAGRDAIVDAFTDTFTLSTFNYHDSGTGVGDEAVGDTALGTAVTEDRVTGTQSQPTSDVYRSVATMTYADTYAITEHGLFSQAAKPGGALLDRTKFAAINVFSGDSIQFTFEIAFAAGG